MGAIQEKNGLTQVLDQLLTGIYGLNVGRTGSDTPVKHTISRMRTTKREWTDHRRMDHAAGRISASISFSLGLDFPAFTFLSRCFFMSSI
jgi:hypothetical protein